MPRSARIKSLESIYHIMVRSVSDIKLFEEDYDKIKYLKLVKNYQLKFGFKVYAYCIMNNHGHILIDSNGADISKIMHGINQCYAMYYNKKNSRYGHVFADRFKSKVVRNNNYLLTVSAYIHKNPKDIKKYTEKLHKYPFSSLGVYLGLRKDEYKLIEDSYILGFYSKVRSIARKEYLKKVLEDDSIELKENIEFKDDVTEYRSERHIIIRDYTPNEVIDFVSKYTGADKRKIMIKYRRENTEIKAISIFLMRRMCNLTERQICKVIGNFSQSRISKLCSLGLEYICNKTIYKDILDDLIKDTAS